MINSSFKWKKIFDEHSIIGKLIHSRLLSIEKDIAEVKNIGRFDSQFCLLSGNFGIAYFHSFFYKVYASEKSLENTINSVNEGLNAMQSKNTISYSFCEGLSGVLWALNSFESDEYIAKNAIDNYLVNICMQGLGDLKSGNYDYLYGGLGPCLLSLSNPNDVTSSFFLADVTKALGNISVKSKKTGLYKWTTYDSVYKSEVFNLGLSHGIPSIISILSFIYQTGIEKELCLELLTGSISWLLEQKLPRGSSSIFPNLVVTETINYPEPSSRLAWCYGDLGVARSLWIAGNATKNELWKKEAVDIMLHASRRRALKENRVFDACLCHGSAGIAHIFNRFYQDTEILSFKEAAEYWYQITLDLARFEDGIGGYKRFLPKNENEPARWINSASLIDGSAGIGLALLAAISDESPKWDRCLLLS